jgi:RNA polymerase sigma factor (sigma-70 family)
MTGRALNRSDCRTGGQKAVRKAVAGENLPLFPFLAEPIHATGNFHVKRTSMAAETLHFLNDEPRRVTAADFAAGADDSGWESVLVENRRWMAAVVFARLHDHQAVEDVLQETALAAAKIQLAGMDRVQAGRWLYRVAVRQAILFQRRKGRRDRHLTRVAEAGAQSNSIAAVSDQLVAMEQGTLLRNALVMMNPKECQLLLWKYCEGWTCVEMADRAGVSVQAIKSRLLRARRSLKQKLLEMQDEWELP